MARVELDIFSGRPNPTWTLPKDIWREIEPMIRRLPREPGDADVPGLGYRGFLLWLPKRGRVYGGRLYGAGGGRELGILEPKTDVEEKLLQTGKSDLDSALYESVLNEIREAHRKPEDERPL